MGGLPSSGFLFSPMFFNSYKLKRLQLCFLLVLCVCMYICHVVFVYAMLCVCRVVCVSHAHSQSQSVSFRVECLCHVHGLTCLLAATMTSGALRVRLYSSSSRTVRRKQRAAGDFLCAFS